MDTWKLCLVLLSLVAATQAAETRNKPLNMAIVEVAQYSQAAIKNMLKELKEATDPDQKKIIAQFVELEKVNLNDFQTDEELIKFLNDAITTAQKYKSLLGGQNKWDARLLELIKYIDVWHENPILDEGQRRMLEHFGPELVRILASKNIDDKKGAVSDMMLMLEDTLSEVIPRDVNLPLLPHGTDTPIDTTTGPSDIPSIMEKYKQLKNITQSIADMQKQKAEGIRLLRSALGIAPKSDTPTDLLQYIGELQSLTETVGEMVKKLSQ